MEVNSLFRWLPDGENFIQLKCPGLYEKLRMEKSGQTSNAKVFGSSGNDEEGFQDTTEIQDISFDKKTCTLRVQSVAGFRERKGVIAVVSEVFDSVTGESVKGAAVTTRDAYSLFCNIDSQFKSGSLSNDSRFMVRTVFYWTEMDAGGKVIMRSREERRNSGLIYNEGEDIVENITVEFPNTLKPRDNTIILYKRTSANVEDPDKVYSNILIENNKLPFYLPFIAWMCCRFQYL